MLISPDAHTAYSGMLPGLIAGHYTRDDCHIDLRRHCRRARCRVRDDAIVRDRSG